MKVSNWLSFRFAVCALPLALLGCIDRDEPIVHGANEVPPQGAAAVKDWLTKGTYKMWLHREFTMHEARMPSPHGINQIYDNELLGDNMLGAAFPKYAAAVKEFYDVVEGPIVGYAMYVKIQAESDGGNGWYYYEEKPIGTTIVDGVGDTKCTVCHGAAGSDGAHRKDEGAHDYVYTQIPVAVD